MHKETKQSGKAFELMLKSTPEVLCPIIKTIASEFTYKGLEYHSVEDVKNTSSTYRKIVICVLEVAKCIACEDCVGIITIQSLGTNTTLFRVPPRNQWFINVNPKNIPHLKYEELVSNDEFNLFYDESYFTYFLERLFVEFQRFGFINFQQEKPPISFRLPHKEM